MKHILEEPIEKALSELGVNISTAKILFEVTGSGLVYDFTYGGTPISIALPTFISTRESNIWRAEAQIGSIPQGFQFQALGIITSDLDMYRHNVPVRPAIRSLARVSGLQIYLVFVSEYDFISAWSIADLISGVAELGTFYRELLGNELPDKTPLQLVG
jgi:hypothetical protein